MICVRGRRGLLWERGTSKDYICVGSVIHVMKRHSYRMWLHNVVHRFECPSEHSEKGLAGRAGLDGRRVAKVRTSDHAVNPGVKNVWWLCYGVHGPLESSPGG